MRFPDPALPIRLAAAAAATVLIGAAPPHPSDFGVAAESAAAIVAEPGREGVATPESIVSGSDQSAVALDEYRRRRSDCQLNRLIRIQGRSEIGVEWRCGPLNARWNDVYTIADGRIARVLVNVPLLVTAQPVVPARR